MMRAHITVLYLVATAAITSCTTTDPTRPVKVAARKTIAKSFDVREIRRGSDIEGRPRSTLIDYEAAMVFRPRRSDLASAIAVGLETNTSLSRSEVAAINSKIDQTSDALKAIDGMRSLVEQLTDYETQVVAFYARNLAPTTLVQDDKTWQKLKELQGNIVARLVDLSTTYVSFRLHEGQLRREALPEDAEDEIDRIYTLMSPSLPPGAPSGTSQGFAPEEVAKYLNQTTALLTERLQSLADLVLKKSPQATLDMEAHLLRGEEKLPVTISPYTIVEGLGRGSKSPRIGIPSKQDLQKVQASYERYQQLSASINELRDLANDKEQLRALKIDLKATLGAAVRKLQQGLQKQVDLIIDAESGTIGSIQTTAKIVREDLRELRAAWEAFADDVPTDAALLAKAVSDLLSQLQQGSLRANLTELGQALSELPENLEVDVADTLKEARFQIETEKRALLDAFEGLPASGSMATAFSSLSALRAIARAQTFGDLVPGAITSNPIDLRIAEDGVVDLNQTPADSGDQLEVIYTLTKNPSGREQDRRQYTATESLDVRKFGYYSTLKSQILFYDRLSDGSSTYSAAPAISYNLHYRPEASQGFFDIVAPGIGVSVSAPNFENGTEIAVGAQVTLFNDVVQVGYGHNISVDQDNGMFYFGLDLIGVFQGTQ